jgi:hypothetical protein
MLSLRPMAISSRVARSYSCARFAAHRRYHLGYGEPKDSKSPGTKSAFAAMMKMKKLDIGELKAAYKGK